MTVAALATLRTPLYVRGRSVDRLLESTAAAAAGEALSAEILSSLRWARALLRRLARLPLSPWRDTCLYRSIAECLVLRWYGVPAAIRFGVRNESPPHGPIVAHAWVVYMGSATSATHVELVAMAGGRD